MAKATRYTSEMITHYMKSGHWDATTFCDIWDRNSRDCPDREAVVDSRTRLTWSQAKQWIDRLALGLLELGIKKDEMVVSQLPNCTELVTLRVACEKVGLLCLPVLRTYRRNEMEYILRHVDAVALLIPWIFHEFNHFQMVEQMLEHLPRLKHIIVVGENVPEGALSFSAMVRKPLERKYPPDYLDNKKCPSTEFSLVLSTTGTTGFPKFVEYPACANLYSGRSKKELLEMTGDDVVVGFGPGTGPNIPLYFSAPLAAAKAVMMERFEAGDALRLIEKEKATIACVVPAMLAMMMEYPDIGNVNLSSLRLIYCTGAALDYRLGLDVEAKMGCPVIQTYGAVDGGAATGTFWKSPPRVRLQTVGAPTSGSEVKLIDSNGNAVSRGDVGEVIVRGPAFISGYFKDPEATRRVFTEDGWYRTGDLGRLDEEGNLVIVGRKKEMIIRGGQNIYPMEIENLLMAHPGISEVAVVGMPDKIMGEKACAYVVPKPGYELTLDDLVSYLRNRQIASYKLPERLELVEKLPLVAEVQKVDKKALQQDVALKLQAERRK